MTTNEIKIPTAVSILFPDKDDAMKLVPKNEIQKDDYVFIIGTMFNEPDPLPIGTIGIVTGINNPDTDHTQIYVIWSNGSSLILLPEDPFVIFREFEVPLEKDPNSLEVCY